MSRETDSSSPGPQGRGGAAYPSGTPPYGTGQYPSTDAAATTPEENSVTSKPSTPDSDGPKTETTLTTRIRINIPGSRPIPPVVVRKPVKDAEGDAEQAAPGAGESAPPPAPTPAPAPLPVRPAQTAPPSSGGSEEPASNWFAPRKSTPPTPPGNGGAPAGPPSAGHGSAPAGPTPPPAGGGFAPPPPGPRGNAPVPGGQGGGFPPRAGGGAPQGYQEYDNGPVTEAFPAFTEPTGPAGPTGGPAMGSAPMGGAEAPRWPGPEAPPAGGPMPGAPMAGGPRPGAPMPGGPMPGAPMSGGPRPGSPMPGAPMPGSPMPGGPVPGGPVGGPMSGAPMSGGPGGPGGPGSGPVVPTPAAQPPKQNRPAPKAPAAPSKKPRSKLVIIAGGLIALGCVAYGAGLLLNHSDVPKGTTVLGVDIGGTRDDAVNKVETAFGSRASAPLRLTVGGKQVELKPDKAGLTLDSQTTVRNASGSDYNPITVIGSLLGNERRADAVMPVDEEKLRVALAELAGTAGSATEGTITFDTGKAVAVPGKAGTTLDVDSSVEQVTEAFRELVATGEAKPVELPSVTKEPVIGKAELDRAMKEFAEPAMSGIVTVKAGTKSIAFGQRSLPKILSMQAVDGHLVEKYDLEALQAAYTTTFDGVLITRGTGAKTAVTPKDVAGALVKGLRGKTPAERIVVIDTNPS
ncbi:hypothetical protein OS965_12775 [Streptomyces sp. H27-G5]|uniref:hypothetical protein n=1 Tax=Streptomyces sp. H27-G5 TaxID=2996698 RepID=UPI00226E04EF|nr:hypothetical protein [Streptomyces sp. H27-G5]